MKLADLALLVRAVERGISETGCRVEATRWGVFISNAEFPIVHMANHAWVDRWPDDATPEEVAEDVAGRCDRLGLAHEEILFWDPFLAFRHQRRFAELGFTPLSDLEMVHLRTPDRERADGVDLGEVEGAAAEPCWDLAAREMRERGYDAEVVRQVLTVARRRYEILGVRLFLATIRGRPVGYGSLLSKGTLGYVSDLYTAAEDRKRGVGSTIVLDLLEASRAAGNAFTSLATDWANPAQEMYRKLGFLAVGERRGFARDAPK